MIALLAACRPHPNERTDDLAPNVDHSASSTTPPAHCPTIDWAVRLEGPVEDVVKHALPTPEGDVIIAGWTTGGMPVGTGRERLALASGARDGFVARLAPAGQARWSHVFGGSGVDQLRGIQLHGDHLWLAGDAEGPFEVDGEPLDAASSTKPPAHCPTIDWAVRLEGPVEDVVKHALPTPEGDVIIAGWTTGGMPVGTGRERLALGSGARDGFVARLAPDGQVRWSHVFGGSGVDQLRGIQLHGEHLWLGGPSANAGGTCRATG